MIWLRMNDVRYENDIRALLMAFFPGEKIVLDNIRFQPDKTMDVVYEDDQARISWTDQDGTLDGETGGLDEDYRIAKNQIKMTVYDLLSRRTGHELPWGTLTGIRPTKIPMGFYDRGQTVEEADAYLEKAYKVSASKRRLCTLVASNEKRILDTIPFGEDISLYIGIPFCPTICLYCSFSSFPLKVWEKRVPAYLNALFKEMDAVAKMIGGRKITTVYMGGGTPTSLTAAQMDSLLTKVEETFDLSHVREFTVEAGRPDSLNRKKLEVIYDHGIRRISINPQSMNQKTLDIIGRRHTALQVEEAFRMARDVGFTNINMDLIMGLPGEDVQDVAHTLETVRTLGPDSMTVHSLAVKRASRLNRNLEAYPPAPPQTVNEMIEMSWEAAETMGMVPYYMYRQKNISGNLENVGYAKPGYEGIYNILIMEEKQTIIALGAGGSSKIVFPEENRIERIENVKNVKDYIERIDEMIERKRKMLL
ncbi:MAG TPA: coproporphyrinogen dehydrogenase HemZ [Candidatus Onthocola gallistercoris]|uniref:Coproporphyrinogen dehydrogenase HemZ n=1 Tax=Candidatus Onthocola gallistercoris TaxID=2840876 RepID=A0A9D1HGV6_9FIRM|nr:coproporphyrinogen dehydrogenase HemZ [Candidatus Onthocola gallistercoris]